jgi:hypothetical protein
MSRDDRIEYLEGERKKIWEKVVALEDLVSKKTSDYESSAKDSSEQALSFKQISEQAKDSIVQNPISLTPSTGIDVTV